MRLNQKKFYKRNGTSITNCNRVIHMSLFHYNEETEDILDYSEALLLKRKPIHQMDH